MKMAILSVALALCLGGCAAGSATAGYSVRAGSADELDSKARERIVEDSVARSNAHTDAEIARLRAELGR